MDFIKDCGDDFTISLKVIPGASKNELFISEGVLKLRITAPPVDNKANKFVITFLSKKFKIPKTSINIIRGETSREKVIKFTIDMAKKEFVKGILSSL